MIDRVREVLRGARRDGRTRLLENEVYAVLSAAGFAVPRHVFLAGPPAAEAALPADALELCRSAAGPGLVLKIASPEILHKSDVGGVAFCAADPAALVRESASLWERVAAKAPGARRSGILVSERIAAGGAPGEETLLSVKQDPAFGPVLVLGLGGVLTEWFGALAEGRSTAILRPGEILPGLRAAADELPAIGLLFRPSRLHAVPPLDLAATAARLERLGEVAVAFGAAAQAGEDDPLTLEEVEVNPLLSAPGGAWTAVDGKALLSKSTARPPRRPLRKIRNLLEPRSAVVVGASASSMNPGRIILRNLRHAEGIDYGRLWAVHPKERTLEGIPCVRSLADLPEVVDLAVVAIPAEGARDAIRSLCATGRAESIILIPGGFAETGRRELEEEIVEAVAASRGTAGEGPVLVGGNCLGIVSKHRYNTFFLPQYKLPFHDAPGDGLVAVSQSGAYLVSLTSNLDGIVFPRASISYGNQMDLTVADFLEYLRDEPSVRVVACYVEGFKPLDGERFARLARELREAGKRVIAFKAGKTALGARATQSHTASLAGDYAVARALLTGAGVVLAETLDMFEDFTKAFTMLFDRIPPAGGNRVGVISNAGFECSAVLDKLYDLVPATLSEGTRRRLAAVLPEIAHADNPVDATPMAATRPFVQAAEAMLEDEGVDGLVVSPIPVTPALDDLAPDLAGSHGENIHAPASLPQELVRLFRRTGKPLVVSVDSGRLYDDFVTVLQRAGIPVFRKIDRASRALSALLTR